MYAAASVGRGGTQRCCVIERQAGGRGEEARRERGNRRGKRGRNYWGQTAAATPAVMPFMAGWQKTEL